MLALLISMCAVLGLVVGSFLNVVIYRVPRHESIVRPRSACPNCAAPIRGRDNIPVLSWLVLRGRCRDCQTPIAVQYPLVELTCAALFAGVAARTGYAWDLPAYLVLLAGLLVLSCIDVQQLVLPRSIVYPMLAAVSTLLTVASAIDNQWHRLFVAFLSAAAWFVLFFIMNAVSPRALGFGDVRLSPLLGVSLGWLGVGYVLLGFFAANLFGAVIGVGLIASKHVKRGQQIPYGIFLSLGTALAILAGPEILSWFPRHRW